MSDEVTDIIRALGLVAHPEGGFYRETFRAPSSVATPHGSRASSTAIYFLLPAGGLSAMHRVRADEVWHHYDGDAVEIHTVTEDGAHATALLGRDFGAGQRPQHVVPAGVWQAALSRGPRFALCGCTVAPGFDFADFEMPTRAEIVAQYPALRAIIERLTSAG